MNRPARRCLDPRIPRRRAETGRTASWNSCAGNLRSLAACRRAVPNRPASASSNRGAAGVRRDAWLRSWSPSPSSRSAWRSSSRSPSDVRSTMLQHVTLEVAPDKVRACVAFWALLGFTEMEPPPPLRDRFTWVEREGTQIHLAPVDAPIVAREGHVAIVAGDYEATLARLGAEGFEVSSGSNAWNAARVFATAPAGHRIEIMSKPPHPPWP